MPPLVAMGALTTTGLITSLAATAGAQVAGGVIASRAAGKASKTQADTASAAIAYQKQQDAANRDQYNKEYARQVDLQNRQIAIEDARRAQVNSILFGADGTKTVADLVPGATSTSTRPTLTPLPSTPPPMPTGWKFGDPIPGVSDRSATPASTVSPTAMATPGAGYGTTGLSTPPRTVADLVPSSVSAPAASPQVAPGANDLAAQMWQAPANRPQRTVADLMPTAPVDPATMQPTPRMPPNLTPRTKRPGTLADLAYGGY